MSYLQIITDFIILAIALYFVIDFFSQFTTTIGTYKEKLWSTVKNSATILWSRLISFSTIIIAGVVWLADFLNAPQVSYALQQYLNPKVVMFLIIGVAVICELARRRNASKDPII